MLLHVDMKSEYSLKESGVTRWVFCSDVIESQNYNGIEIWLAAAGVEVKFFDRLQECGFPHRFRITETMNFAMGRIDDPIFSFATMSWIIAHKLGELYECWK